MSTLDKCIHPRCCMSHNILFFSREISEWPYCCHDKFDDVGTHLICPLRAQADGHPPIHHPPSITPAQICRRSIGSIIGFHYSPIRAFSWLKAADTAFTFKTLLRHYAKQALTPQKVDMKLGPRRNYHKGRAAIRHYANQTARPL